MAAVTLSTSAYIAYLKKPRCVPKLELHCNILVVPFRCEDARQPLESVFYHRICGIPSDIIDRILAYLRCVNDPIEGWVRLPSTELKYAQGVITQEVHLQHNYSHFYLNDGKEFTWNGKLVKRFAEELYFHWDFSKDSATPTYMQVEYHEVLPVVYRR